MELQSIFKEETKAHRIQRALLSSFGSNRESPSLLIGESSTLAVNLFSETVIFFLEVFDDLNLFAVDPAGKGEDQKVPRGEDKVHWGRLMR